MPKSGSPEPSEDGSPEEQLAPEQLRDAIEFVERWWREMPDLTCHDHALYVCIHRVLAGARKWVELQGG